MKKIFTLLSATLLTGAAFAQTIPNAGFENWTTVSGYRVATSWDSPNPTTSMFSIQTCDSGMSNPAQGAAYMKLTTKTSPLGPIPGAAVTGTINVSGSSYSVSGGFPSTTRPVSLTGKFQHMGMSATDHGRMGVFLWKRNTTTNAMDTVAMIDTTLTGMQMSWASFTLPLKYRSTATPDSAIIVFLSSAATTTGVDGSFLYVDDLAFAGTVPNSVISVNNAAASMQVFPNPASGTATVYYRSNAAATTAVSIADMSGRSVKSFTTQTVTGENNITVDLKGIAQGLYIISVANENGTVQTKLMVN